MRIRRGFLFWGLLLIPLGAITLLVRAGLVDSAALGDSWRLWPLILVGIGLAILLGRRRSGLVATVILALTMGLLGGSALAASGGWLSSITDCVATPASMSHLTDGGLLATSATVELELNCGEVSATTQPGSAWTLNADYQGGQPTISASGGDLRIGSPDGPGGQRQQWTLALPTASTQAIRVTANAASATFDLTGTTLSDFSATINAGDLRLNGTAAAIGRLDVSLNAGRARVTLGPGTTNGSLSTNAGSIELCVPASSGLVLHVPAQLTFSNNLGLRGLAHDGDTWSRTGTAGLIDLSIEGSVGGFTLDPDGGC